MVNLAPLALDCLPAAGDSTALAARENRISEALGWGGRELKRNHKRKGKVIYTIGRRSDDGQPYKIRALFILPGKEKKNENDMMVILKKDEYKFKFSDMWGPLLEVAKIDESAFRALLVLIYRLCYMRDCVTTTEGIRYQPSLDISALIDEIDRTVGHVFKLPNGQVYGTWGMLRFLDLMGWQEDVKYHVDDGEPRGPTRRKRMYSKSTVETPHLSEDDDMKVGRVNNMLTIINVCYTTYINTIDVVDGTKAHVDDLTGSKDWLNMTWALDLAQALIAGKGVAPVGRGDLLGWFPGLINAGAGAGRHVVGLVDFGAP